MEEILKTSLLEFEKSTFLIDLVKHKTENLYIKILQTTQQKDKPPIQQEIKINPSVINSIVEVIKKYQESLPKKQEEPKKYLREDKQQQLQDRYLKGISINDLCLQFNRDEKEIEQILKNRGIKIVD